MKKCLNEKPDLQSIEMRGAGVEPANACATGP
jgi:hypothetical protein